MAASKNPRDHVIMRGIAWFYKTLGKSVSDTHGDMKRVYGDGAPTLSTVSNWYGRYEGETPNLDDRPRSGRQKDRDLATHVANVVEEEPHASSRRIAELLGSSKDTVVSVVKDELGLRFFHLKWVPHELSVAQKEQRVIKNPGNSLLP